jgi:hypothetical protein
VEFDMANGDRGANRKGIKGIDLSPDDRVSLYAQARYLPKEFKRKCGLLLPFSTYFQDPFVAKTDPKQAIDEEVFVAWEPGLTDGPTSSRLAIVDFNADTGVLEVPAVWNEDTQAFLSSDGKALNKNTAATMQFHQVSLWAILQCALSFFEDASALGRSIPWAFEGNRLIVVPHAGYGGERLLRSGQQVASVLLLRLGGRDGLYLPLGRYRQSRIRPRRARRDQAALQREQ